MKYTLYNSIDEMLAPETLSALEGRLVKYVHCRPFNTCLSRSGSSLLVVETNDGRSLGHYMLKRVSLEYDWIMRVTEDYQCRSVSLGQSGLLDRLKPAVEQGIVACSRDGAGWAILMHDLTAALLPTKQPHDRRHEHTARIIGNWEHRSSLNEETASHILEVKSLGKLTHKERKYVRNSRTCTDQGRSPRCL